MELGDVSPAMQDLGSKVPTALRDFGSNFSRDLQQLGNRVIGLREMLVTPEVVPE
jgi:hypothetical protein